MSKPLPYIDRIREYYAALGYGKPYEWASFDDVPFARLKKPVSRARITLVTTAAPYKAGAGEQGPGAPYNGKAKFFEVYAHTTVEMPDLRLAHVAIDREHTKADDQAAYFPLEALKRAAAEGKVGTVGPRFFGLPTDRSQAKTLDVYSTEILKLCQQDEVDAVLLLPNCPVCHQSVSLCARMLEAAGIATVVMGCAQDIVERVGVPRLLFSDFPLGNPAGLPNDKQSQDETLSMALNLLETAIAPRSTEQSPQVWNGEEDWKKDYSNAALLSEEEIARRRVEFDRGKADAKKQR